MLISVGDRISGERNGKTHTGTVSHAYALNPGEGARRVFTEDVASYEAVGVIIDTDDGEVVVFRKSQVPSLRRA